MEISFTTDVTSNAKEQEHCTNTIISQPKKPIFSQNQKFHFLKNTSIQTRLI